MVRTVLTPLMTRLRMVQRLRRNLRRTRKNQILVRKLPRRHLADVDAQTLPPIWRHALHAAGQLLEGSVPREEPRVEAYAPKRATERQVLLLLFRIQIMECV